MKEHKEKSLREVLEIPEVEDIPCPKCKSIYVMYHKYDESYRICMKCDHSFRT